MSSLPAPEFDRPLPDPSHQAVTGSYTSAKKRNHPFYVLGLFDIFANVSSPEALYPNYQMTAALLTFPFLVLCFVNVGGVGRIIYLCN